MRPQGRRRKSLGFYNLMPEEELDHKNDQAKNEHKNANAVNTMHVFDKAGFRTIGIGLFDVEIFGDLLKYTHKKTAS